MEFNKPDYLKLEGNLEENFRRFKQEVDIYFTATETDTKDEKIKIARVLNLIGPEALKLYNTFKLKPKTAEEVLKTFEKYCIPKKNEIMEHFHFFSRKQSEDETFYQFYTDLKALVATCSFDALETKLLRTQLVIGLRNVELRDMLLTENLELDEIVEQCEAMEKAEINRQLLQIHSKEVHDIIGGDQKNHCGSSINQGAGSSTDEDKSKHGQAKVIQNC